MSMKTRIVSSALIGAIGVAAPLSLAGAANASTDHSAKGVVTGNYTASTPAGAVQPDFLGNIVEHAADAVLASAAGGVAGAYAAAKFAAPAVEDAAAASSVESSSSSSSSGGNFLNHASVQSSDSADIQFNAPVN